MANLGRVIHKDPPRAPAGPVLPVPLFDSSPHRNVGVPLQRFELEAVPDELLIATLCDLGQPRWAAEEIRRHGGARWNALRVWCDVQDAAEGNAEARERVEYVRHMFNELRKQELIADRPGMSVGFWER